MLRMILYDMEIDKWRGHGFTRNSTWRSTASYQCMICHSMTNKWSMGGWPGLGPRLLCPCEVEFPEQHIVLERLHFDIGVYRREIEDINAILEVVSPNIIDIVQNLIHNLQLRIQVLNIIVEGIAIQFKGISDIDGLSPEHEVLEFFPTSRSGEFLEDQYQGGLPSW